MTDRLPHHPGPHWGEVGIHGIHRGREWDEVITVEAPGQAGDEAWLVVLPDRRVLGDDAAGDLTAALRLEPPYRAHAVRRNDGVWAIGAQRLEVAEIEPDLRGDAVELSFDGVERSVRIDGEPTLRGVPALERLGASRYRAYVVTANRLDGHAWEVAVAPL